MHIPTSIIHAYLTHTRSFKQEIISIELEFEEAFLSIEQRFRVCREFGYKVPETDLAAFTTMRLEWSRLQQKSTRANDKLRKVQEGFKKDLFKAVGNFKAEVRAMDFVFFCVCMCV
jgi:hypothetical protein